MTRSSFHVAVSHGCLGLALAAVFAGAIHAAGLPGAAARTAPGVVGAAHGVNHEALGLREPAGPQVAVPDAGHACGERGAPVEALRLGQAAGLAASHGRHVGGLMHRGNRGPRGLVIKRRLPKLDKILRLSQGDNFGGLGGGNGGRGVGRVRRIPDGDGASER